MNDVHENANVNVTLNGKQAGMEIDKLESKVQGLKQELKELRKANDLVGYKKKQKELTQYNKELRNAKRQVQDVEHVLKNLNKSSLKDLTAAQRKLNSQLRDMDRSHPDYKKFVKQNVLLSNAINKTRAEQRGLNGIMSRSANTMNKYFNLLMTGIGVFTGLIFSMKEWVSGLVGMDDQLANVMKTTGLTRNAVRELHTEFKYLNTRTPRKELLLLAEEAGRLGKKSKADVMEFVRVGNMIQTALGDDLGDNAAESIKEVGKLVNIYQVGEKHGTNFGKAMEMVGSAINETSAQSQAQAPFLIDMLKRMGGIADQAEISADQVIGYGAALDNLGQQPETSATALNKTIVNMFKDTETYARIAGMSLDEFSELLQTDSNEAFLRFLEGLNGNNEGLSVMVDKLDELQLDGARSIQVLASLASNTKLVRQQQDIANKALLKATSLSDEYNVKNENMAGNLAIIGQRLRAVFVNSTLNKGLEKVVGYFAKWAKYSLVEKLDAEMKSTNRLVDELVDVNTQQKRRKEIYDELKAINGDIVKGMSDENIQADKLAKNMASYNEQMVKRIFLQKKADTIADMALKRDDLSLEKLELEMELRDKITNMINATAKKSPETAERMQKIRTSGIDLLQVEKQIGDQYFYNRKAIGDVGKALTDMRDVANEVKVARGEESNAIEIVNTALEKQKKLELELLGAKVNRIETGGSSGPNPSEVQHRVQMEISALETISALRVKQAAEFKEYYQIRIEDDKLYGVTRVQTVEETMEQIKMREQLKTDEVYDYETQKYMETTEGRLLDLDIMHEIGIISEQEYADKVAEIHEELRQNKMRSQRQFFDGSLNILGALSNMLTAQKNRELAEAGDNAYRREQIEKEFAEKQKEIAIKQAYIRGALAIQRIAADVPKFDFGITTAILMAAQAALTLSEVSVIKSQQFATGGYTGHGSTFEPAGIVHKGEYVIPQWVMQSPGMVDIVEMIEAVRTGGVSNTTNNNYSTTNNNSTTREDTRGNYKIDTRLYEEMKEMKDLLREGLKFEYKKFRDFESEVNDIENSVRMS